MDGGSKLRVGLVTGAIALAAGIYLLPKTPKGAEEPKVDSKEMAGKTAFSIEQFLESSKTRAGWNEGTQTEVWETALKKGSTDLALYDSIAKTWDASGIPGAAGWYYNQKALKNQHEADWLNAAYRYFDAFKSGKDSLEASYFLSAAITSYNKVLEINPSNLNAKTDLGILYAEGTAEPMKGIMLLREVVTADPKHENAQLNLGFLSMKSGQFDKALERFNKVLEINPARIDMYVYIGEAYVRTGKNDKAIESFEIFKSLSNDQQMIKDVDAYITSLKESKGTSQK
ncbi:MAG: tetratricopeptide repeat protein [Bacteroidia bacterium]|nr:tetratricopeptide repeat protein [Bacteroidota bacterium]MBK9424437.1 tetratricopeptide repeat protein [Bacteroidota bacterium]MBL0071680.1 tetratricopeptide repeat protein [Bacteroidota bacterium]MBP9083028.1 tetratricopeptide repeat protein [Bacteroidia bacterium]